MAGIKEKIQQNALIFFVVCVVACVGAASGVQQYFYSQRDDRIKEKHEAEVRDLDTKLASIKRGMSGNEYFDIRKLLLSSTETDIPQQSTFFPDEQFYAGSADAEWTYSRMDELTLASELTGTDKKALPPQLTQGLSMFPLHVWRSKQSQAVQGHDVFKNIFPLIAVEKVPLNRMREMIGLGVAMVHDDDDDEQPAESKKTSESALPAKTASSEEFIRRMDEMFRGDTVGAFFTMKTFVTMAGVSQSSKTTFRLIEVQKVGNVLYSQSMLTLRDVQVAEKHYSNYYIRQELMMVSTPEDLYLVQTFIPSDDPAPRGKAFSAVNNWLSGFRIRIS